MDPIAYNEKTLLDGSSYRLTFMSPGGTIRPEDPLWRYVFGIVRVDNSSTRPLYVFPARQQAYLGLGYAATIGAGSTAQRFTPNLERGQKANLTGPDTFEPVVLQPGQSIRMASRSIQSVLRLLGAFGTGPDGRALVPLDRICPSFNALIGIQYATPDGTASGEAPSDNVTEVKATGPCYAIDPNRDWARDWEMAGDFRNVVDAVPDWEPYPSR